MFEEDASVFFDDFAESAQLHRNSDGTSVPCRVIIDSASDRDGGSHFLAGPGSIVNELPTRATLMVAEVGSCQRDDRIEVPGRNFRISVIVSRDAAVIKARVVRI